MNDHVHTTTLRMRTNHYCLCLRVRSVAIVFSSCCFTFSWEFSQSNLFVFLLEPTTQSEDCDFVLLAENSNSWNLNSVAFIVLGYRFARHIPCNKSIRTPRYSSLRPSWMNVTCCCRLPQQQSSLRWKLLSPHNHHHSFTTSKELISKEPMLCSISLNKINKVTQLQLKTTKSVCCLNVRVLCYVEVACLEYRPYM